MAGCLFLVAVFTWGVPGEAVAQRGIAHRVDALEAQVEVLGEEVTNLRWQLAGIEARLDFIQGAVQSYSGEVDCDAGGSLVDALNAAPASAPVVHIGITGTCRENIHISRDFVSLYAKTPGAAIEAPPGRPIAVFVTGRRIRLDDLVIRSSGDSPDSEALRVLTGTAAGANLHFEGGVSALRNATLELFTPTIDGAGRWGVGIFSNSYAYVSDCQINDAGVVGIQVESSALMAFNCTVEASGETGVQVHQSSVLLWGVSVVDSGQTGVNVELGSSVEIAGGIGMGSRIAGSATGLDVSGGSTANLGESTIELNGDGVTLSDASVVERDVPYSPLITGNTNGVRCAAAPAVPQLSHLGAAEVTGNGQDFVDCAVP
jgi:hypothetical protein